MEQNQFGSTRSSKLALENTAWKHCRPDMSDVNFEIGKSSYTAKIFGAIVLLAASFGVRMLAKPYFEEESITLLAVDVIFWCFIALIAVLVSITIIHEKKRPTITVSGDTVFCDGKCWTSHEISRVRCTKWLERVEVYVNYKKVLYFPWEMDNSELFIAWVKRCGITFEDMRMKLNEIHKGIE